MFIDSLILKIKRAETPGYARLKKLGKAILTFQLPIPRVLDPIYSLIRYLQILSFETEERISVACFRYPVLRAMCASIGKRLEMEQIPNIDGPVKIYLGDDVRLSGHISISGGRVFSDSEFRVGNRSFIGAGCVFSVAKSITIGDDVLIAGGCTVSDYSQHPLDPEKRTAGMQVDPEDVRPIRIENRVWLGKGAMILPGVTVGEGAVVGAATVVTKDVPPGHICVGNPGRLLSRTVYESRPERNPHET
jgi:acetyltransferase-like isoleucine patch superfamily enzyme